MKLDTATIAAAGAGALCIALIAASAYLFLENSALKAGMADALASLDKAKAGRAGVEAQLIRVQGTVMERDLRITELSSRLGMAEAELNESRATLAQKESELAEARSSARREEERLAALRQDFEALAEDIRETQETINESVQWFRDNSQMPPELGPIQDSVTTECRDGASYNLGCFAYLLEEDYGFSYLNETSDRLYSLKEIYARKGGDCEDYSIFISAMIRSLATEGNARELVGWEPGPGGTFKVYERGRRYWYYEGTGAWLGHIANVHPYPICYLTDVSGEAPAGHCIVALSPEEIRGTGGLSALEGAKTFEPQNGQYMGAVGRQFHLCADGEEDCAHEGDIVMVIGDTDLYEFGDGEWDSLELQRDNAGAVLDNVSAAMSSFPSG